MYVNLDVIFGRRINQLEFVQSGGVSEGVDHPAVYSAREFYRFRPQFGGRKSFLL